MNPERRWTLYLAALIAVALVGAACGSDSETRPAASSSGSPATPSQDPSPEPSADEITVEVWLATGEGLFPITRSVARTSAVGRAAMSELLGGPNEAEAALGITSSVPDGTQLLGLDITGGTATVDLSSEFDDGGGSLDMSTRLAQLVYTLTQFETVDEVLLKMDGSTVTTFSDEGLVLDGPQSRKDYRDLLPPIVVLEPSIGQEITSPAIVSGTANVFEATVSMRLIVAGDTLVEGFATATCGTGCRGGYEHELDFSVTEPTEATLEVFESSAEDGSPLHVVSIPLTLMP